MRNTTMSAIGPKIGTKFSMNATAPHSTGLETPHNHMMGLVATPTSALMQDPVNR